MSVSWRLLLRATPFFAGRLQNCIRTNLQPLARVGNPNAASFIIGVEHVPSFGNTGRVNSSSAGVVRFPTTMSLFDKNRQASTPWPFSDCQCNATTCQGINRLPKITILTATFPPVFQSNTHNSPSTWLAVHMSEDLRSITNKFSRISIFMSHPPGFFTCLTRRVDASAEGCSPPPEEKHKRSTSNEYGRCLPCLFCVGNK